METSSCFCAAAAAVYICAVLWKLRGGYDAGFWTTATVASLHFVLPPAVHGVLLLCSSLILVCVTERGVKLLPVKGRAVLVTGCDSGFGHALAKRLSGMGATVFAGVLDVNGDGARQLREQASGNLQVLQLDVTDSEHIETARRYIRTQVAGTGLWGLVNNAGILQCLCDAEFKPIAVYRRCMDVNFLGAVRMSQAFLPLLRRARGRIVNISSFAGDVPVPLFSAYAASKAALSVFSKVMRLELSAWGVRVALIQPTGFKTSIFGNHDDDAHNRDALLAAVSSEVREDYGEEYISSLCGSLSRASRTVAQDLSPVVDDMCHALLSAHPKPVYTPGQMAWLLPFLHRCCPTAAFDAITMKLLHQADCEPAGLRRS